MLAGSLPYDAGPWLVTIVLNRNATSNVSWADAFYAFSSTNAF